MMMREQRITPAGIPWKEILFLVILHIVVFIFYSFDRYEPKIELSQICFFLNYSLGAMMINYLLLPRFLYRNRYLEFAIGFIVVIAIIMTIEELILEKIFYPDTRGTRFPGVFVTLISVLPVMVILSGGKFGWDALRSRQEVDVLKKTMAESELQFLKSQMNPHFLFNNLNNLYAYAIENSPKTPEIILELSSVLRYVLYECQDTYVSLSKEVEQMAHFIRLNELQIEDRGTVAFHTEGDLGKFRIAPLILMVFIENAFKHSQAAQHEGIMIDTQIKVSPEGLCTFVCRNNYQSQAVQNQLPRGIGLENAKKRLQLLYPDAHSLQIRDNGELYDVELQIELR